VGETTSGGFAPTLGRSIALARVQPVDGTEVGDDCAVLIRDKPVAARIVKPPFVRQGEIRIALD
jgi:aminomethyltransferase